jgi:uncharacterized protein (DUF433 family)
MSTAPNTWKHLEPRLGSSYRQLFIKGTRIRADVIYGQYVSEEEPIMTPEEIAADSGLPVEAVLEAIAYIESNPPEVLRDRARDDAMMEATGMNDPNYDGHPKVLSIEERMRIENL